MKGMSKMWILVAAGLAGASCGLLESEELCETDNTGSVAYLNDTGKQRWAAYLDNRGACGPFNVSIAPGERFRQSGTPGETYGFCVVLDGSPKKFRGSYPAQCEERNFTLDP